MADSWTFGPDDDDDYDDNDGKQQGKGNQTQQLPSGLRKHVRDIEKKLSEVTKERDDLKQTARTASVKDVVKAKGFDPAVAMFVPSSVDPSEEAIGKWLDENGKFFAKAKTETEDDTGTGTTDQVDQQVMQGLGQIGTLTASSITPTKQQELLTKLNDPSLTPDQLTQLLRSQGAKV